MKDFEGKICLSPAVLQVPGLDSTDFLRQV